MKVFAACLVVGIALLGLPALADEKMATKEEIKALITEDAKKSQKAAKAAEKAAKTAAPTAAKSPVPTPPASAAAAPSAEKTVPEPPTTLPRVEVNKSKITVLDHELHEQNRKIAAEEKNIKSTGLDAGLNSTKINPTILGGYSTKVRTGLAQERVELMEFEKELIEEIARAKTKEEKAALKKQLDDIRTMRRTLDSPR